MLTGKTISQLNKIDDVYDSLDLPIEYEGYTYKLSYDQLRKGIVDYITAITPSVTVSITTTPTPTTTLPQTPTATSTLTPTPTPTITNCSGGCRQYTLTNPNPYSIILQYYDCDNIFRNVIFTGATSGYSICSQSYPGFSSSFSDFQVVVELGSCCYPSSPTPTPTNTSTPTPTPSITSTLTPTVTPTPTNCPFGVFSSTTATTLSLEPVSLLGSAYTQSYQYGGTRFYIYGYNQDASGINGGGIYPYLQVPNDLNQNFQTWGQQFWASYLSGSTLIAQHTSFSRASIWPTNYKFILNTWVGYSECFTVVSAGTHWIGIGADNDFRLYIDGNLILDTTQSLPPVGYANTQIPFVWWHVYPFYFTQGEHRIQLGGWNRPAGTGDYTIFALACEIYDQSIESLTAATSINDLNVIYSTSGVTSAETFQNYTGAYLPIGVTCPSGYTYYCGECYQYSIVCPSQTPTPSVTSTPTSTIIEPTSTPSVTSTPTSTTIEPTSTPTPTVSETPKVTVTPTITPTETNKG